MEGTMGEIRMFGGTFAPRGWMFCQGQSMPISQWDALYALLGTTYGGDGVNTFNLPNMQSRLPVGTGKGPGLSQWVEGEMTGVESVTLTTANMATHSHPGTPTFNAARFTPKCSDTATGNTDNPAGAYPSVAGSGVYSSTNDNTMVTFNVPLSGSALVGGSGGSQPHENIQPVIAVNYIICVEGIFPSRN